jgi:HAD superfamily hydrolase (TIGR01490 family)
MQKTYALFDFDGTLIRGDSIILLCLYARRRGMVTRLDVARLIWTSVLYGLRLCSSVKSKERALSFLTGMTAAQVNAVASDFVDSVLVPRLRPEALEAIDRHRAAGHEVLLVSASSSFYLKLLKEKLGLTDIICTRLDMDETGVFADRVCGENCSGVQKALRLAEYLAAKGDQLDFDGSTAYGDSMRDLDMMRLCAHKVAVNPSPRLRRALRKLDGVTLVNWREPEPKQR